MLLAIALLALTDPASLVGVWSVGPERNCETGEAWVFTADGYYVEVDLPSSPIKAVGIWEDMGTQIHYTHAHMPFASLDKPMARRAYIVTRRSPDRIDASNYRGEARSFHRCPASALRAGPKSE